MKQKKNPLLVAISLIACLVLVPAGLASAATINLAPNISSVSKGSIVSVGIYENSGGEPVNAARATLSYPANLLDFVSVSNSSAFSIVAANSGGGGTVQVDRGALPAVTGRQLIATVNFRAKTDVGSAAITVTSGSVLSANTNGETLTGSTGANITLKAVPPPPAPPPPPDTTPPTISDVKITAVGPNTATITWKTSEPANSKVDYGYNSTYGIVAADNAMVTEHKITLNPNLLKPLSEVHFLISSVDAAGNEVKDKDASFTTKGMTVRLTLVDHHKKPLKNALVDIGGKPVRTNDKGQATLLDLQLGKNRGIVTYKQQVLPITVNVNEAVKDTLVSVQSATVGLKVKQTNSIWPAVLIIVGLLIIGSGFTLRPVLQKRLKRKKPRDGGPSQPPTTGGTAPPSKSSNPIAPKPKSEPAESVKASTVLPTDTSHMTLDAVEAKYSKKAAEGDMLIPAGLPRETRPEPTIVQPNRH